MSAVLDDFASIEPLPGGFSGETFVATVAGERVVVRIYGRRSVVRGPGAAERDAAVLAWASGVVPVPRVLEVRRGDPEAGLPALLVTSHLPGVLLEDVVDDLGPDRLGEVGRALGVVLARLAGVAVPRAGDLVGPDLTIEPWSGEWAATADLPSWVEQHEPRLLWAESDLAGLRDVAERAQGLLDTVDRACLVHSDLNPKNVLVDPGTGEVTGLLDWEFAHAGSPYADLGNLLRFHRAPAFLDAVLETREALVPDPRPDALDLARAADLVALVDFAARADEHAVAARATALLRAIARSGDLHAAPPD